MFIAGERGRGLATERLPDEAAIYVVTQGRRPRIQDTWIAAATRAHGVPVFTQDAGFDGLAIEVVRV